MTNVGPYQSLILMEKVSLKPNMEVAKKECDHIALEMLSFLNVPQTAVKGDSYSNYSACPSPFGTLGETPFIHAQKTFTNESKLY